MRGSIGRGSSISAQRCGDAAAGGRKRFIRLTRGLGLAHREGSRSVAWFRSHAFTSFFVRQPKLRPSPIFVPVVFSNDGPAKPVIKGYLVALLEIIFRDFHEGSSLTTRRT